VLFPKAKFPLTTPDERYIIILKSHARRREIMEKILVIGCKRTMNDVCIGCSRCTVAFNRKDGEFARYKGDDAQLLGILNCGDCPGTAAGIRLTQFKLWNAPMGELPTKIHLGNCLANNCPYRDTLRPMIEKLTGVEVVAGTHPYKSKDIFKPVSTDKK
jgi:predicted metal-binding protein